MAGYQNLTMQNTKLLTISQQFYEHGKKKKKTEYKRNVQMINTHKKYSVMLRGLLLHLHAYMLTAGPLLNKEAKTRIISKCSKSDSHVLTCVCRRSLMFDDLFLPICSPELY